MLLERVPLRAGMIALDVGCGTGFPLLELAGRLGPSSQVYGVDPWTLGLGRARLKAEAYGLHNVHIIEGDATALRFDDRTFDLITSNLGINNFSDPDAVLRECFRVMRHRGILALTSNYAGHMKEFYQRFAKLVPKKALRLHIAHRSTPKSIAARIKRAGFKVRKVETSSFRMRFANGAALFHHYFIRLGFLPAWKELVPEKDRVAVFRRLERQMARPISLTIPAVYIEAMR
jgi:ubiquinone/menaquinone biosynthesis C-methylase UbiE